MHFDEHPGRPWKIADADLSIGQRDLIRRVEAGARGQMPPNLSIWLHNLEFATAAEQFGLYVTQLAKFTPRQKEIVILAVAACFNSKFEWHFHAPMGLRAGLTQNHIDALSARIDPGFEDPLEQVSWELSVALLDNREISDDLYRRAVQHLDRAGVHDLIGLMGLYTMIAQTISFYRVPVPSGAA